MWVWELGDKLPQWPTVAVGQTPNAYANFEHIDFRERVASPYGEIHDMFAGLIWSWLSIDRPGTYTVSVWRAGYARSGAKGVTIVPASGGCSTAQPVRLVATNKSSDMEPSIRTDWSASLQIEARIPPNKQ